MKKWFSRGRVVLGVLAGCFLVTRLAPVPEWREWRNEKMIRAIQKGDVGRAALFPELGARAIQSVYVDWPWATGRDQNPRQLLQAAQSSEGLPLLCYALKYAPPKSRAALALVLLSHGADANDSGTSRGELCSNGIVARTPLERALQTHDEWEGFAKDENTALVLRAYGAK